MIAAIKIVGRIDSAPNLIETCVEAPNFHCTEADQHIMHCEMCHQWWEAHHPHPVVGPIENRP